MKDFFKDERAESMQVPKQRLREELEELLRRVDALPEIDPRPADEILGYGKDGF